MAKSKYQSPYHFFKTYAGFSYDPKTQTPEQGKHETATKLAQAERDGSDAGLTFEWSLDGMDSIEWIEPGKNGGKGRKPWGTWQCICKDEEGKIIASLYGIDFGRDGQPWGEPYRRVVEAELAMEGLQS